MLAHRSAEFDHIWADLANFRPIWTSSCSKRPKLAQVTPMLGDVGLLRSWPNFAQLRPSLTVIKPLPTGSPDFARVWPAWT